MAEATTNTLADALLDDLDDLSDVDDEVEQEVRREEEAHLNHEERQQQQWRQLHDGDDGGGDTAAMEGGGDAKPGETDSEATASSSLLSRDAALQRHLREIRKLDDSKPQPSTTTNSSSNNYDGTSGVDEYRLIVQSNRHLARLADELINAHGALAAAYKPKFPELEEIIPNPVQYKNAVQAIGNKQMDVSSVEFDFLAPNQVLTINVSGSTTSGRPLSDEESAKVDQAVADIDAILTVQRELTSFVETRMTKIAPNVCALLGSSAIAAQVLGLAGGLEELSKIPACNLQVLGQVKQTSTSRGGLSSITTRSNEGILINCDLIQRLPKHLQKKALKTVAAKLALAARCDFVNAGRRSSSATAPAANSSGIAFRAEIEKKMEKWQEPDKAPVMKALPK